MSGSSSDSGSAQAVRLHPNGPLTGAVAAPASKSVTNRLLAIATLAHGTSELRRPLVSDDSAAMRECLLRLGATITGDDAAWKITGTGGRLRTPDGSLDARLSGTTARFMSGLLTLSPAGGVVSGRLPLRRRPIGPLMRALRDLGAEITDTDGGLPVRARGGGLDGGEVKIDVSASSQFASAVMLVAPLARHEVTIDVHGEAAGGYIGLTAQLMEAWGADLELLEEDRWRIGAQAGYRARTVDVAYDASAAGHLFALAVATGGAVTVTNVAPGSAQPDALLPAVLERLGATVERRGASMTVRGGPVVKPLDVSLGTMPDQVTTVAALAALAGGRSVLRDVGVTRLHETDRLAALSTELGKLGARVDAGSDYLVVDGGQLRGPARLATYDDHRLAMSFAAIGACVPGITIDGPGCVAKTYPHFWDDFVALGGKLDPGSSELGYEGRGGGEAADGGRG